MSKASAVPFYGFDRPESNFFRLPNHWTDITADMKSLSEVKVVEYVLRHTWGFQEYGISKRITLSEFMNGRKKSDGSRIDRGTGLSKPSVIDGLRSAVAHGYLIEEVDSSDRGRVQKRYQLRMRNLDPDVKNLYPPVNNPDSSGKGTGPRTGKETNETKTVNGSYKAATSPVSQLPDRHEPTVAVESLTAEILDQMGDSHSQDFYRLVAARVPPEVVRSALSEIKHDGGAQSPAKVFTARMNRWALARLKKGIGE